MVNGMLTRRLKAPTVSPWWRSSTHQEPSKARRLSSRPTRDGQRSLAGASEYIKPRKSRRRLDKQEPSRAASGGSSAQFNSAVQSSPGEQWTQVKRRLHPPWKRSGAVSSRKTLEQQYRVPGCLAVGSPLASLDPSRNRWGKRRGLTKRSSPAQTNSGPSPSSRLLMCGDGGACMSN